MNVQGQAYRTVWVETEPDHLPAGPTRFDVRMIEQRRLPHEFTVVSLTDHRETARAIREMIVRGAPAIGASAAYGLAQVYAEAPMGSGREAFIAQGLELLRAARPTAQDLFSALAEVSAAARGVAPGEQPAEALRAAKRLADESARRCRQIGINGGALLKERARVLTHCNAGWLACVDWGTALAPIYTAAREGRRPSVLVDETRPRLQGANLTAWELGQESVDYEIIADNAAGHLMRSGEVDLVITGADRIAANGDAANKIGTYEKALLAHRHGIPFYVAAPASTFDLECPNGDAIPIEERSADELLYTWGRDDRGRMTRVRIAPEGAKARNPAFDVTPAELIAGLITEHGIIGANPADIRGAFGRAPAGE
jgi:methylthioribose-1-phosphate isomerase